MESYSLESSFAPSGDQPAAIDALAAGVGKNEKQTLLGVTGSGKTFTLANTIARTGRNALIISHNKTLASQLYSEFKEFFPSNSVEYFVSYYDYYLPESYSPATDSYVEKNVLINEKIEQMRFSATASLLAGGPTIVIASVSCIYGLGSPADYGEMSINLSQGAKMERRQLLSQLAGIQYERNDAAPDSGSFRSRGNTVDVYPSYKKCFYRIELDADSVKSIAQFDFATGEKAGNLKTVRIFPARHFVVSPKRIPQAVSGIREELAAHLPNLKDEMARYRLKTRVNYDAELIEQTGFCKGVENYSRYFDGRKPGEKPYCLLDFFSDTDIIAVDESHVTLPQIRGMHEGDRSRKKNLVDYGFRLPSAFDNRPLKFAEFEQYVQRRPTIFISATPSQYERDNSARIVEQLVRPTGIIDPAVEVRSSNGQIADLCAQIAATAKAGWRTLVTTLTKRQAEDLSEYLLKNGVKARYLHSEIDTLERTEIIRRLRLGDFDCLVGVNLLREGLDIPEVALVAVLDADKEGFLRNETSLIQTAGRAARNASSRVILYAERTSAGMQGALREMARRRLYQTAYNRRHGITPSTIIKKVGKGDESEGTQDEPAAGVRKAGRRKLIDLEMQMREAAETLDFERAIALREQLRRLGRI
ncbi:MAG: excinuclease ABC subunit UvrB [Candidatus Micrarchaeota archaeon]